MTEQPPSYPPPPPGGYGYPPPGPGYPPPRRGGTNGMAVASLVCSLFGWLCLIGPILGLIFGFIALNQIKQTGQGGRGMALAGIIIGGILAAIIIGLGTLRAAARHTHRVHSGAPAVVMIVEPQAVSPIVAA
ncbi:MAG TPA: DUF4190 domain-containing protein [Mycobacterium sp.]|nr:DUF4190 domain-containing protein [Mycobacterium sp.]